MGSLGAAGQGWLLLLPRKPVKEAMLCSVGEQAGHSAAE